jgi:hypothetical protein
VLHLTAGASGAVATRAAHVQQARLHPHQLRASKARSKHAGAADAESERSRPCARYEGGVAERARLLPTCGSAHLP